MLPWKIAGRGRTVTVRVSSVEKFETFSVTCLPPSGTLGISSNDAVHGIIVGATLSPTGLTWPAGTNLSDQWQYFDNNTATYPAFFTLS